MATTGCSGENPYNIDTNANGNCYLYATGLPGGYLDDSFPGQKYSTGGYETYSMETADELRFAILKEYISYSMNSPYIYTMEICNADTPLYSSDEWIIAYCNSGISDFHFLRKDYGIGWTHKPGRNRIPTNKAWSDTDKAWSGTVISSPNSANLGPYDPTTLLYYKVTRTRKLSK